MNKKLILRLILFSTLVWIITTLYTAYEQLNVMDYHYSGFPLKVSESGGMCVYGPCTTSYNYPNLVINVLVYLFLGFVISYLSLKLGKKVK